jgi:hypothetical protein
MPEISVTSHFPRWNGDRSHIIIIEVRRVRRKKLALDFSGKIQFLFELLLDEHLVP